MTEIRNEKSGCINSHPSCCRNRVWQQLYCNRQTIFIKEFKGVYIVLIEYGKSKKLTIYKPFKECYNHRHETDKTPSRRCSSSVEHQLPKLGRRVRLPSSAYIFLYSRKNGRRSQNHDVGFRDLFLLRIEQDNKEQSRNNVSYRDG